MLIYVGSLCMFEIWFKYLKYVVVFGFYLGGFIIEVCFLSFMVYLRVV
jgi:hypothetical protein